MKKLIALLIVAASAGIFNAAAASYSTEATMSALKEGTYMVDVRVFMLVEEKGRLTEKLISHPKIVSPPGETATLYAGLRPTDPQYTIDENVTVEVSRPYPNESGTALCVVVVKLGDKTVSKSRFQLQVEGPGRAPLMVMARDVDRQSVQAVEEKSQAYVLLKFTGRTREEVKKLANENYGNKVQIQDLQGGVTEGGLSFGIYQEVGMAVRYENKNEAQHVASILRGGNSK